MTIARAIAADASLSKSQAQLGFECEIRQGLTHLVGSLMRWLRVRNLKSKKDKISKQVKHILYCDDALLDVNIYGIGAKVFPYYWWLTLQLHSCSSNSLDED